MTWALSPDGDYYMFTGTVSVPKISNVNIEYLQDARSQERRELAAVTSQAFADCVYPPPKAGATISGTGDEYTVTLTLAPDGAIETIPSVSGSPWQALAYSSGYSL